ncbi:MAG: class I SAM-dependent methyltransferase [Nocardioides sp.]
MKHDQRVEEATELVAAWESQQEVYIAQRETRFELMLDLIDVLLRPDGPLRVLDLGCGTGSLSSRVLSRVPEAHVTALDIDPLLLALGRSSRSATPRQPEFIEADLRADDWEASLPFPAYDAIVSSTALHWLTGPQLAALHRRVRRLLVPGGVFLNGDYLPASRPWGRLTEAVREVGVRRESVATAAGALSWEAWWEEVARSACFAEEFEAHNELFAGQERDVAPSLSFHLESLREAGFVEVELVWHDLTEGLYCALAGDSSSVR